MVKEEHGRRNQRVVVKRHLFGICSGLGLTDDARKVPRVCNGVFRPICFNPGARNEASLCPNQCSDIREGLQGPLNQRSVRFEGWSSGGIERNVRGAGHLW
jgi:hypothetical protein